MCNHFVSCQVGFLSCVVSPPIYIHFDVVLQHTFSFSSVSSPPARRHCSAIGLMNRQAVSLLNKHRFKIRRSYQRTMSSCRGRTHGRERKGAWKYVIDFDIDGWRHNTRKKTDLIAHENASHIKLYFQLFRGSNLKGSFLPDPSLWMMYCKCEYDSSIYTIAVPLDWPSPLSPHLSPFSPLPSSLFSSPYPPYLSFFSLSLLPSFPSLLVLHLPFFYTFWFLFHQDSLPRLSAKMCYLPWT